MNRSAADQFDETQTWLLGPAGRQVAQRVLTRRGLPSDASAVDDLCQQVLFDIWRRLQADPFEGSVEAYARTCLTRAAIDLLRRGEGKRLADLVDFQVEERGATSIGASHDVDPIGDAVGAALHAEVRHALHALGAERRRLRPWTISAALVTLELAAHPDLELLPDTPRPHPRSPAAGDGARWAALAYAGRSDCFAQPETGAVRERRSTALTRVRDALTDAWAATGGSS